MFFKQRLSCKRNKRSNGFTLIELIMVITIVGVLSIIAIPFFFGKTIEVSAQADQLVSALYYTRTLSMTTGKRYSWVQLNSNSYQIRDNNGTAIIYVGTGSTTINLSTGISFGTITNLPNNLITFDGKGSPYIDITTPGTPLSSIATIPLTGGSTTKNVLVTPTTGWITEQ